MSADFIDSNVFVYLLDEGDARRRRTAEDVVEQGIRRFSATVSFQVVQETLNVVTSRLLVPLSAADASAFAERYLLPLWDVMPSRALYDRCLGIQDRYQYSFYDSLIIAAALEAGCTRLYSEDLQHGQTIEGLTIEDPFRL